MKIVLNEARIAAALIVVPFAISVVAHYLGDRSVTLYWNGPLYFPSRLGLELHGLGVFLVPTMFVGVAWLALLSLRSVPSGSE